ncbi:hypothetical protein, partial [Escherichia coli]|uniref:hypothetical protein n=1 Tax=Escherichia coli TaxID=562 RepID=UPI002362E15C
MSHNKLGQRIRQTRSAHLRMKNATAIVGIRADVSSLHMTSMRRPRDGPSASNADGPSFSPEGGRLR